MKTMTSLIFSVLFLYSGSVSAEAFSPSGEAVKLEIPAELVPLSNKLGINCEKSVNKTEVCPGEEVIFTLIVRILEGQPGVQYRDIVIQDSNFTTNLTINSTFFDTSTDTNSNGYLDFGEEFVFNYSATIDVDTTNIAFDMANAYFISGTNEFLVGEVTGEICSSTVNVLPCLASIGDFVWFDANGDGLQDPVDPDETAGISNVVVHLWALDINDDPDFILNTVTTDVNGAYLFTNLDPTMNYIVGLDSGNLLTVAAQPLDVSPLKGEGVDDNIDNDIDALTLLSDVVMLSPGEVRTNVDAAVVSAGDPPECEILLEKTVSLDGNCPGVENVEGAPGTVVTYCFEIENTSPAIDLFNIRLTDNDISPAIADLQIAASLPVGATVSFQVDRPIPVNPLLNTATVTAIDEFQEGLCTDSDTASVNPLATETGSITGYAFYDLNNNGIADDNLTTPLVGFNNVTVQLLSGGAVIDSIDTLLNTGTGEYGYYEFTGLALDQTYRTRVVNSDLRGELANVTGAPASSFVNTTAVASPNITLTSANPTGRFDFGIRGAPTAISLIDLVASRNYAPSCNPPVSVDEVNVNWNTATETDNIGFYIYRSEGINGPKSLVNEIIILAQGNAGGATYSYKDDYPLVGDLGAENTYYWLEDVDTSGLKTMNGPFPVLIEVSDCFGPDVVGSIELNKEGIYRLSPAVLQSAGLDDINKVAVLVDGVQVPCKIADGFLIFYAPSGATIAELYEDPEPLRMEEIDSSP